MTGFREISSDFYFDNHIVSEESGLLVDCSSGPVTVTLEAPIVGADGSVLTIVKNDDTSNLLTVTTNADNPIYLTFSTFTSNVPHQLISLFVVNGQWRQLFNEYFPSS